MDECMICGLSKAAHEGASVHHHFSENGELRPKERRSTPAVRVQPGDALLRLITVLRSKEILDKNDLDLIFGGGDVAVRGQSPEGDREAGSGAQAG